MIYREYIDKTAYIVENYGELQVLNNIFKKQIDISKI